MIIEYVRTHSAAKPPMRANPSDAGLDVFYSPESEQLSLFGNDDSSITLKPGDNHIFRTGLRFGVPHGYVLEVKNRSSMAAKKGLIVGACVIDSGYDGEVFIDLHNIGNQEQTVKGGDKIAQLVMTPVVHFRAMETSSGDLYGWYPITISDRGDGALGSTDKK